MLHRLLITILLAVTVCTAFAQQKFTGRLINARDSTIIPYAVIRLQETDKTVIADSAGYFYFLIPDNAKQLSFNVSIMGFKATIRHKRTFAATELVYLDVAPKNLQEAEIIGRSAADIVKRAIQAIPDNYADSSYFAYSSYRQYQFVNGFFMNLIEANPVVMLRFRHSNGRIGSSEAFALRKIRRCLFFNNPLNDHRDDPSDLFNENPVFRPMRTTMTQNRIIGCRFSYDTSQKFEDYVINYVHPVGSTETFGSENTTVEDFYRTFPRSTYETGTVVIDRKTLAFKKIVRHAHRYPDYSFFFNHSNYIHYGKLTWEFKDADMIAEYEQRGTKWYTSALYRRYSCDVIDVKTDHLDYDITDVFEWRCDSMSRYIPGELLNSFYPRLDLYSKYVYDKQYWQEHAFPFYFYDADVVYKSLERWGNLESQFSVKGCEIIRD
jgi:hypothetical protein